MMKRILSFLGLMLYFSINLFSQSLSPGDIAFIGYNTDSPDGFAFVALVDIPAGEEIYFTDKGWNNTTWTTVTTEVHFKWTSPAGGISAGTTISIIETSTNVLTITGGGSVGPIEVAPNFSLSAGDQVLAYQTSSGAEPTSPTFIAGVHGDYRDTNRNLTNFWNNESLSNVEQSTLPPGLTNGLNCVALFHSTEVDNAKYNGTFSGSKADLLAAINNYTNWISDNTNNYSIIPTDYNGGAGFTVTAGCTDPTVPTVTASPSSICPKANSTLTISGTLNDATAWHIYTGSCGGTSIGNTTGSTFVVSPTTTTTYFVRGEGGCVTPASCGQVTVTAVDNAKPVITVCAPTPANLSANGSCQATMPDLTGGVTATDDCTASPTINQSPAPGSTLGLGTTTVTFTATDDAGRISPSCLVNITVVDNTDPVITVCAPTPANISANGSCQATMPDLTGGVTATDNCTASPVITQSPAAGSTLGLGTTTVTLTATDGSGNTATCSVNVTVVDDTDPVITVCASTPANISANGSCLATMPDLTGGVTATDNCTASPVITQSPAAGTTIGLGTTTVTLTATDGSGNTATCSVNVTVIDDTDPVITVCASTPANISANGSCQGTMPDLTGGVTATDNCTASPVITQSPAAGTTIGLGTTTVTLTATDGSGNTATCSVNVTVVDDTDPVITVCAPTPANISANGSCQGTMPDLTGGVTATDNCTASPVITQSPAAGTAIGLGTTTVTLTATDGSGNTATCSVNVTVIDDTDPVITVCASTPANISANGSCQATMPDLTGGVTATDNCTASPVITQSPTAGATIGLGTTTVTLTATDGSGNTATCSVNVTVIDDTDPVITVCASTPANISANGSCQGTMPDLTGGVTATDNCTASPVITQSPATGSTLGLGTTTVTLTATDGSGNTATCSVNVTVVDDTDPVITVCASTPANISANGSCQATMPDLTGGVTATDNCTASPVITQSPAAGTTIGLGTTTVTLTATDGSGNTATCSVNVTVIDDTDPVITVCASTPANISANGSCQGTMPDLTGGVTATDNCTASPVITQSPATGSTLDLGTTTVTLTAADGSGNTATCSVNVTVVDDTDPVITVCASTPANISANGSCQATMPDLTGGVTASDNCTASPVITQSPAAGTTIGLGTTTVTLTATDGSGNTATCSVNVTVIDDTDPVITVCASTPANISANGSCQGTMPDLTGGVTATDNCTASPIITQSPAAGSTLGLGTTTVTLTAADGSGNTATCSVNVTVVDDTDPVITVCASTPANISANGSCQATMPDLTGGVTATDNCTANPTITQSPAAGTTIGLGTTAVTFTATDGSGNTSSTCSVNITVIDDTDPVITTCAPTPANISADGSCQASMPDLTGGVTATDNCTANPTITQSPAAGATIGLGVTAVTLTATDGAGNTATCSVNVTVVDDTDPVITACASTPANISADGSCQASMPDLTGGVTATDNCTANPTITQSPAAGATIGLGVTAVTLTATDGAGNTVTCSVNVTVVDDTDPVITACASTPANISANGSCQASMPDLTGGVTATDNCTANPTITQSPAAGATIGLGVTAVTLTATDGAGNTATCSVNVTVVDDTDPVITACASTPANISADGSCQASMPDLTGGVTATDNCTANPTITQSPAAGATIGLGVTAVTLTATDGAGNTATCSVNVTVVDDTDPVITACASTPANISADGSCQASMPDLTGGVTATDNCTANPTITQSPAAGATIGLGVTAVTLTATDGAGNTATCSANVTVVDDTDPVITACASTPANISADGSCQASMPDLTGGVTATDNCTANPTITQSPAAGATIGLGVTAVTLTATDGAGNTATCSVNVTVVDDTDPVITACASTPANISADGSCQASMPDLTGGVTATDNCAANPTITQSPAAGATIGLGVTAVTLTATDGAGNTATCSVNVTVVDDTDPVITACASTPANISADGSCQASMPDLTGGVTATDNCAANPTITQSPAAGATIGLGVTAVTLTATDGAGNTATCSVNVTVVDDSKPLITNCPSDVTVNNTLDKCEAEVNWTPPTVSDNCGTPTITSSHNPGDKFPVGTTTVSYTAEDGSGNKSTCSFKVIVKDNQDPVFVDCPNNIEVSTENDKCEAIVNWTPPTAEDNCSISGITSSHSPGSVFPIGKTVVQYVASDPAGNKKTCEFEVIVKDNEKPYFTNCPSNITINTDNNQCQALVNWTPPTSHDNCVTVNTSSNFNPGDLFPTGTTVVKYIAEDAAGNKDSCKFEVIVIDNEKPLLSGCPSDINMEAEIDKCTATVNWTPPTGSDNCLFNVSSSHNPGESFNVGTTEVKYIIEDQAGNKDSCMFNVVITDTQKPIITNCSSDITISADPNLCGGIGNWTPPSGSDNCNFVLNSNYLPTDTLPIGTTQIVYIIEDVAGLKDSCKFNVTVIDNVKPVFTNCLDDMVVETDPGSCQAIVSWTPPTATDNCEIDEVMSTIEPGESFEIGTTTVDYAAIDIYGNMEICSFKVTVVDKETPKLSNCPADMTLESGDNICGAIANWSKPTGSDNCSFLIYGNYEPGDTVPMGTTLVKYYIKDAANNIDSCSFTVTINDSTLPVIADCPTDINLYAGSATCEQTASWIEPTASDNCNGVTLSSNYKPGDLFSAGTTTVTYTATDNSGNSSSCSFNVIVSDTIKPVLVGCPSNITKNSDDNGCGANVSWTIPIVKDNCPDAILQSSHLPGDLFPVGTTTVKYEVEDASGNKDSCSFDITIEDRTKPTIGNCPKDTVIRVDENDIVVIEDYTALINANDNCSVASIVQTPAPGSKIIGVGQVKTINIVVTDQDGNDETCSFKITTDDHIGILSIAGLDHRVKLFPNPARENLNIEVPENNKPNLIEIYNSLGAQLFYQSNLKDHIVNVNLSKFDDGVYFMKIYFEHKITTQKLVISK